MLKILAPILLAMTCHATNLVPVLPFQAAPVLTPSGCIFLVWNRAPGTTVVNMTTKENIFADNADGALFSDLPMGSANTFVAFNSDGVSNEVTGVATNSTRKAAIEVYSYRFTMPIKPGVTNWVMTSTNLLTWYRVKTILSTNTSHQLLWTNDGGSRYFRTVLP